MSEEENKKPSAASDEAKEDKDEKKEEQQEEPKKEEKPAASEGGEPRPEDSGREEEPKEESKKEEKPKEEEKPQPTADQPQAGKVTEKVKKEIKVPAKFKDLVKQIEEMSIMDLAELVKILEEKFGVSPMVAAPAAGAAPGAEEGDEEKTVFTVELKDTGSQKIQVIKAVREITGKGLKEAKDLTDKAPQVIRENVKKEEAEEVKKMLEEAGATVELK